MSGRRVGGKEVGENQRETTENAEQEKTRKMIYKGLDMRTDEGVATTFDAQRWGRTAREPIKNPRLLMQRTILQGFLTTLNN